jgi:hypothetical protein
MDLLPPNTCSADDPVMDAVRIFDQDGVILNTVRATVCNANWLCVAIPLLEMYPGVTSCTWQEVVPEDPVEV